MIKRDRVRVVASPDALATLDLEQIATGTLTMQAAAPTGTAQLGRWDLTLRGDEVQVQAKVQLWFPSRFALRDAVCAGAGIAELPMSLVFDDIKSGRLVDLVSGLDPDVDIGQLHASRWHISRRASVFASFLYEYFEITIISPRK